MVEIREDGIVLGEIAAELVIALIAHQLYGLKLQRSFDRDLRVEAPRPLAKIPAIPLALQEARRVKRKQNSARRKTA